MRPYDWQADEDLEAWRFELDLVYRSLNPLGMSLDACVEALAIRLPRSLPFEAHD